MILSDRSIVERVKLGDIVIEPFDAACVQPASVDLHLAGEFQRFAEGQILDSREAPQMVEFCEDTVFLYPGDFLIATTTEWIEVPDNLSVKVWGRSGNARRGLQVHAAGLLDPGFKGQITLELSNNGSCPIRLWAGMGIAQIEFEMLDGRARRPYGSNGLGSHYQHQLGATAARPEVTA